MPRRAFALSSEQTPLSLVTCSRAAWFRRCARSPRKSREKSCRLSSRTPWESSDKQETRKFRKLPRELWCSGGRVCSDVVKCYVISITFFYNFSHLNELNADQNCRQYDENFSQKQNKIADGINCKHTKRVCRQNVKSSFAGDAKRWAVHRDDDVSILAQVLKEVLETRQAALTSAKHESRHWVLIFL